VVASVLMGFFIFESEGTQINTLSPATYVSDVVDLSGNTNLSVLLDTNLGGFDCCEIIDNKLYISPPLFGDIAIYFKGIQPNEQGLYTVEYGLNNSANKDFSLIITSESGTLSDKILSLRYQAISEITDILYADNTVYGQFFASPYYREGIDLNGEHIIKTEFNINSNLLIVTIDSTEFCRLTITDYSDTNTVHYGGGLMSDEFIINYVKTNIIYIPEDVTNSNFFVIIAQILAWNVSEAYLPNAVNIILIKIPMMFLGIAIALYVRGVA